MTIPLTIRKTAAFVCWPFIWLGVGVFVLLAGFKYAWREYREETYGAFSIREYNKKGWYQRGSLVWGFRYIRSDLRLLAAVFVKCGIGLDA